MAPATRNRRRPSNTAEAPPSPFKAASGSAWAATRKRATTGGEGDGNGGGDGERKKTKKTAFVTVGTTRFDALVRSVDSPEFEGSLIARGFARLVVQAGAGARAPEGLLPGLRREEEKKRKKSSSATAAATSTAEAARFSGTTVRGLSVEFFDYAPTLKDHFASADLVVTHAGAGSIFETLSMGSRSPIPLIAVPNGALMHNHQAELASELERRGLLVSATPESLARVLLEADFSKLRRYEAGGVQGVVAAIDELSGRSRKVRKR